MPVLSQVKVKFLDGKTKDYNVHWKSLASLLIQNVNKDLDLQQSDFFGLQFNDREDNCVFLDPTKKMDEQIKSSKLVARELRHVVRFYPHNTEDLEEYTTYLLALQMRSDVHMGAYHKCMEKNVLVYMLATILQSVYGDHELPEGANANYISNLEILPSSLDGQEKDEILQLVRQKHVELRNMSGGEADKKLLEISSKQSMYGLKFLPTQDSKGNNLKISPNHQGVVVYNGYERRDLYSWMKIRKLAFKKNKLLLKLKHDSNPSKKGSTVELTMSSRDCCKNMWKNCVENYAFFKLESQPKPKPKPLVFKRGSTFRYSGRTNKQLHEMRLTSNFKRSKFERLSLRAPSTKFSSSTTSLSARSDQITSIDEGSYTLQENNSNANNTDQSLSKIVEQIEDKFNKKAFTDERPASTNRQSTDWKVESGDLHSNTAASLATTTTQQTTGSCNNDVINNQNDVIIIEGVAPPLPPKNPTPQVVTTDRGFHGNRTRAVARHHSSQVQLRKTSFRKSTASFRESFRNSTFRDSLHALMTSSNSRVSSFTTSQLELASKLRCPDDVSASQLIQCGLYSVPKQLPPQPVTSSFRDVSNSVSELRASYEDEDIDCDVIEENDVTIDARLLEPIVMEFDDVSDSCDEGLVTSQCDDDRINDDVIIGMERDIEKVLTSSGVEYEDVIMKIAPSMVKRAQSSDGLSSGDSVINL